MARAEVEYEQFRLHDGEDDKKTDALNEFLGPVIQHESMDWEGDNDGITVWLKVRVDDTIQLSKDGWIRVVRRTDLGSVTFTSKDMG